MATPKWAADLLARVWDEQGQGAEMPEIRWRRNRGAVESGGVYYPLRNLITISAGSNRADAQATVLHEIGHALTRFDASHSARFWDVAFGLMRLYYTGPVAPMVERQVRYRHGAIAAARRHGFRLGEKRAAMLRARGYR